MNRQFRMMVKGLLITFGLIGLSLFVIDFLNNEMIVKAILLSILLIMISIGYSLEEEPTIKKRKKK